MILVLSKYCRFSPFDNFGKITLQAPNFQKLQFLVLVIFTIHTKRILNITKTKYPKPKIKHNPKHTHPWSDTTNKPTKTNCKQTHPVHCSPSFLLPLLFLFTTATLHIPPPLPMPCLPNLHKPPRILNCPQFPPSYPLSAKTKFPAKNGNSAKMIQKSSKVVGFAEGPTLVYKSEERSRSKELVSLCSGVLISNIFFFLSFNFQ